jgi:hypothetical protein
LLYSVKGKEDFAYNGELPPTEGVWSEGVQKEGGSTGGGLSKKFAMPSYQSSAASSLGVINGNSKASPSPCGASLCREVPDVSADASAATGYVVFTENKWGVSGGTSAATPLWAAFASLVNASAACHGTPIGFANPALYSIAGSSYLSNFHDVVEPDLFTGRANNNPTGTGLYPVGPGYDMTTGIGTPIGPNLAASLCALVPAQPVSPIQPGPPTQPTGGPIPPAGGPPAGGPSTSGSSGAGTSSSGTAATISSAQIAALLDGQLTPSGKAAKIAALLKAGGFALAYKTLEAGSAVIEWYQLPPGAKLAKNSNNNNNKKKPVLVAAGQLTLTAAGTATLKIRLNAAGKRLLSHATQVKLSAKSTFTPTGGGKAPVTVTRTFLLKR